VPGKRDPHQEPRGRSGRHRPPPRQTSHRGDNAILALMVVWLSLVVAATVVTIALND